MKFYIGFAIIAFTHARVIEPSCDGVIVHNINHEKEILVENKDSPYQLTIDYDTHHLFFSFTNKNGEDMFKSAYINLKTNEFNLIPGIIGGFANTVDEKKHTVYLGGSNGIYTFDFDTKTAKHVAGTSHNIWQMFYKNDLFYSIYPEEKVYVYKNGYTQQVPELADTKAMLVGLDNNLDFYFSNSSGLHKLSHGETIYIGDYNLNSITADNYGNLYFSTPDGIFYINEKSKVERLATIPNIYGVAIEADGNIIYASEDSIIRLKPTKTPCSVDEKANNHLHDIKSE